MEGAVANSNLPNGNEANANAGDNDTCLQLALEGEKLCKAGNCRDGVAFFEAALQAGTDDFRTLSAIYSQLGNAYFYMGDYVKAMQYHKHDLTLARTMGDRLGEAKASGNLGNTLKVMGKFEEAVICCRRHLEICQEHRDRVGEGRALYNLGNVYHAKGKHIGRLSHQDPGEFPEEVKSLFEKAVQYYEQNMGLMVEIGDRAAQGRACGNLGNVHYLLGNFSRAIHFHQERLKIAREFGDRAAERRAHSNLGNAHIFLGEFERAADHYKRTLLLAQDLGDRAVEAQACYSLGNTYTLLKDYPNAIEYHLRHLRIAQELYDKVGEGRACWSLGNAHSSMGQHLEAYQYAKRHLDISRDTGDRMGQATAQLNLADLCRTLGYTPADSTDLPHERKQPLDQAESNDAKKSRRVSMEQMDLIKMTPDAKKAAAAQAAAQAAKSKKSTDDKENNGSLNKSGLLDEEDFFDFISRFQSKRMDDQRCSLTVPNTRDPSNGTAPRPAAAAPKVAPAPPPIPPKKTTEPQASSQQQPQQLFDLIGQPQSQPQRPGAMQVLPGLNKAKQPEILQRLSVATAKDDQFPDESFFEMLMKCQGSRIEEQRSSLPASDIRGRPAPIPLDVGPPLEAPTVPDEDFFNLIQRVQSGRLEDQRASLPRDKN
eukprot:15111.XXX_998077_1001913_1 [CDS] Oithona nana genome sequencing.